MFETDRDVLAWYEKQPRSLNDQFLKSIPWHEVPKHPLNPEFIPVLIYMRDVESFTDIYYRELLRTPTGKNPVIRRFMERWSAEESDHGELLNRFLNEAGIPTGPRWQAEARARIPARYTLEMYLQTFIAKPFGDYFSGTHMVWGAINEMTTLQGYRRLWQLAGHPVLEYVLRAIAHEESVHSSFYWNIARLKLEQSPFARKLARFLIHQFWSPVGQGTKTRQETNSVIATLFKGTAGVDFFDRNVTGRLQRLPGFASSRHVTERVAEIAI